MKCQIHFFIEQKFIECVAFGKYQTGKEKKAKNKKQMCGEKVPQRLGTSLGFQGAEVGKKSKWVLGVKSTFALWGRNTCGKEYLTFGCLKYYITVIVQCDAASISSAISVGNVPEFGIQGHVSPCSSLGRVPIQRVRIMADMRRT